MIKKILTIFLTVLISLHFSVISFASNPYYNDIYSKIDVLKIDDVIYVPIRELSDKITKEQFSTLEIGYYNRSLYTYSNLFYSQHQIETKYIYINDKKYTLSNESILINDKLYVPLEMLNLIIAIKDYKVENNQLMIQENKHLSDEIINNRPIYPKIKYEITNELGEPVPDVSVSEYNNSFDDVRNVYPGVGHTDENGVYIANIRYYPVINEYEARIEVVRAFSSKTVLNESDKKKAPFDTVYLHENFYYKITPETRVIKLVLSNDTDYLLRKLPVSSDEGLTTFYKQKWDYTYTIKTKDNKPAIGAKIYVLENDKEIFEGVSDLNGELICYSWDKISYMENYKIKIVYNNKTEINDISISDDLKKILIQLD